MPLFKDRAEFNEWYENRSDEPWDRDSQFLTWYADQGNRILDTEKRKKAYQRYSKIISNVSAGKTILPRDVDTERNDTRQFFEELAKPERNPLAAIGNAREGMYRSVASKMAPVADPIARGAGVVGSGFGHGVALAGQTVGDLASAVTGGVIPKTELFSEAARNWENVPINMSPAEKTAFGISSGLGKLGTEMALTAPLGSFAMPVMLGGGGVAEEYRREAEAGEANSPMKQALAGVIGYGTGHLYGKMGGVASKLFTGLKPRAVMAAVGAAEPVAAAGLNALNLPGGRKLSLPDVVQSAAMQFAMNPSGPSGQGAREAVAANIARGVNVMGGGGGGPLGEPPLLPRLTREQIPQTWKYTERPVISEMGQADKPPATEATVAPAATEPVVQQPAARAFKVKPGTGKDISIAIKRGKVPIEKIESDWGETLLNHAAKNGKLDDSYDNVVKSFSKEWQVRYGDILGKRAAEKVNAKIAEDEPAGAEVPEVELRELSDVAFINSFKEKNPNYESIFNAIKEGHANRKRASDIAKTVGMDVDDVRAIRNGLNLPMPWGGRGNKKKFDAWVSEQKTAIGEQPETKAETKLPTAEPVEQPAAETVTTPVDEDFRDIYDAGNSAGANEESGIATKIVSDMKESDPKMRVLGADPVNPEKDSPFEKGVIVSAQDGTKLLFEVLTMKESGRKVFKMDDVFSGPSKNREGAVFGGNVKKFLESAEREGAIVIGGHESTSEYGYSMARIFSRMYKGSKLYYIENNDMPSRPTPVIAPEGSESDVSRIGKLTNPPDPNQPGLFKLKLGKSKAEVDRELERSLKENLGRREPSTVVKETSQVVPEEAVEAPGERPKTIGEEVPSFTREEQSDASEKGVLPVEESKPERRPIMDKETFERAMAVQREARQSLPGYEDLSKLSEADADKIRAREEDRKFSKFSGDNLSVSKVKIGKKGNRAGTEVSISIKPNTKWPKEFRDLFTEELGEGHEIKKTYPLKEGAAREKFIEEHREEIERFMDATDEIEKRIKAESGNIRGSYSTTINPGKRGFTNTEYGEVPEVNQPAREAMMRMRKTSEAAYRMVLMGRDGENQDLVYIEADKRLHDSVVKLLTGKGEKAIDFRNDLGIPEGRRVSKSDLSNPNIMESAYNLFAANTGDRKIDKKYRNYLFTAAKRAAQDVVSKEDVARKMRISGGAEEGSEVIEEIKTPGVESESIKGADLSKREDIGNRLFDEADKEFSVLNDDGSVLSAKDQLFNDDWADIGTIKSRRAKIMKFMEDLYKKMGERAPRPEGGREGEGVTYRYSGLPFFTPEQTERIYKGLKGVFTNPDHIKVESGRLNMEEEDYSRQAAMESGIEGAEKILGKETSEEDVTGALGLKKRTGPGKFMSRVEGKITEGAENLTENLNRELQNWTRSSNPLARGVANALNLLTKSAGETKGLQEARMSKHGAHARAIGVIRELFDRLNEIEIGLGEDSVKNVWKALDPKMSAHLAKVKGEEYSPSSREDLSDAERDYHDKLVDIGNTINDINYAIGAISPERYEENIGNYFPRMYDVHKEHQEYKVWRDMVGKDVRVLDDGEQEAKDMFINSVGKNKETWRKIVSIDDAKRGKMGSTGEGKMDLDYALERVDLDKLPEDVSSSVIADPAYAMSKRLLETMHNLARYNYSKNIIENSPGLVSDSARPGFIEVPDSPQFGMLRNKYVAMPIARDMAGSVWMSRMMNYLDGFCSSYDRSLLRRWMKKSVTTLSIPVQLGNVAFNAVKGMTYRIAPWEYVRAFARLSKEYNNKSGEIYKYVRDHGAFKGSPINELGIDEVGGDAVAGKNQSKLKKLWNTPSKMYAMVDDVDKMILFERFSKRTGDPKEALKRAVALSQDYTKTGAAVGLYAKAPLVGHAFIRFPVDLVTRLVPNAMKYHGLTTIALVAGIGSLINFWNNNIGGADIEEQERKELLREGASTDLPLVPDVAEEKLGLNQRLSLIFPLKSGNNTHKVMDVARLLVPLYTREKLGTGAVDKVDTPSKGALMKIIQLTSGDPLLSTVFQLALNKDYTGRTITDPAMTEYSKHGKDLTEGEKALNVGRKVFSQYVPPILREGLGAAWAWGQEIAGEKEKEDAYGNKTGGVTSLSYGTPTTPTKETLRMFGLRIDNWGPDKAREIAERRGSTIEREFEEARKDMVSAYNKHQRFLNGDSSGLNKPHYANAVRRFMRDLEAIKKRADSEAQFLQRHYKGRDEHGNTWQGFKYTNDLGEWKEFVDKTYSELMNK